MKRKTGRDYFEQAVALNKKLRKGTIRLEPPSLDSAIVGVRKTKQGHAPVYEYGLLVEAFMRDNSWDYECAVEWVDYNTVRGWPYLTADKCVSPVLKIGRPR